MIYELYTNKDVIFKNAANLIMIKEIHQLKKVTCSSPLLTNTETK